MTTTHRHDLALHQYVHSLVEASFSISGKRTTAPRSSVTFWQPRKFACEEVIAFDRTVCCLLYPPTDVAVGKYQSKNQKDTS